MKKIIIILFAISLFQQLTYCQWIQQVSGTTFGMQDCDFINENTGWVCGGSANIQKTTNGGLNWIQQPSGVTKILYGIDAVDANLIWCVGEWNTILKSTNGGNNWQIIRDGPTSSPTFRKVHFLNSATGWMLKSNYILRTTNGGITFDSTNTVFTFLWDIYFKDAMTGVLCADGARILKSTDGGAIWNLIPVPLHQGGQPNFYRLSFVNNTFGWTVGEGSSFGLGKLVYRTTDFGSSWDTIARVPYPNGEVNYSVFFSSLNTGYCGGTFGYIYKSTNGGFNWIQQSVPIDGFRRDFYFVNDTIGWVVGGGGYILKTTNGGTYLGIEPVSNEIPKDFKLYQNYPNPFNPVTKIKYSVKSQTSNVKLKIFDVRGKEAATLADQKQNAGTYSVEWDASAYPSGVYFAVLLAGGLKLTRKMVLIK
jgi:photosystem II stability/assembly factor-like uncharacterized protein